MIGAIETAMLARLQAASDAGVLGYRYVEADSLPVDLDAEQLLKRIKRFPAVWTVYAGWRPVKTYRNGSADVLATFHVVVAAKNLRNERAARLGVGEDEVGSYQMVEDVVELLAGQRLGLEIGGLTVGESTSLFTGLDDQDRRISALSIAFTSEFHIEPRSLPAEAPDDFTTFHANWDFQPHGNVGPEIPDDEDADLTTEVHLPRQEPQP